MSLPTHATLVEDADDLEDVAELDDLDERPGSETASSARRRSISPADWERFEGYVGEIFTALGMDLDTAGTRSTPTRFLRALYDSTAGYDGDPKLLAAFPTECHGDGNCESAQVIEGPIPFFALCEHHALPFLGHAYVGYVAHEGIIGISKLTRLVRVVTSRFGVQERMTHQVADELERLIAPHGVAVYLEAHHLCTQMRGVRDTQAKTRTTAYRGIYLENPGLRSEFFDASGLRRTER